MGGKCVVARSEKMSLDAKRTGCSRREEGGEGRERLTARESWVVAGMLGVERERQRSAAAHTGELPRTAVASALVLAAATDARGEGSEGGG